MATHADAVRVAREALGEQRKETEYRLGDISDFNERQTACAIVSAIRELALDARLHYIEEQGQ